MLRQVSAQTSVHIVMGTGYYKDGWLPAETHALTVDEMTEMMVGEIPTVWAGERRTDPRRCDRRDGRQPADHTD